LRSTGHEETKQVTEYKTIDGNWSQRPVAYCSRYKGYLTEKQMRVHNCQAKHGGECGRLQDMRGGYIRRMRQEQYQDRMIDRMDKMVTALNRTSKSLEHFVKFLEKMDEACSPPPPDYDVMAKEDE